MHFLTCDRGSSLQPCDPQAPQNVTSFPRRVRGSELLDCGFTINLAFTVDTFKCGIYLIHMAQEARNSPVADWIRTTPVEKGGWREQTDTELLYVVGTPFRV